MPAIGENEVRALNTMAQSYWRLALTGWTALLVGSLAMGAEPAASNVGSTREGIVALALDAGSHSLLKAYPRALYLSHNEGRDWAPISLPRTIERGRISSVAISAHSATLLYVAGPGFGVLRSANGGRSWDAKNGGLPSNAVAALTLHIDQPDTLYAYLPRHGIFRSEDAGDHWRLMDAGPRAKILQFVHSNMPGSMQTGWLFAATTTGVGRSMDCFCGWRDAGGLGEPVRVVAYDPSEPRRVYAAAADGLFVSANGGEQWSRVPSPRGGMTALVVASTGVVFCAFGDGELFRSADHGNSWIRVDA